MRLRRRGALDGRSNNHRNERAKHMKTKRNLALAGLALALGATVLVTAGAGGGGKEPFKLEGTWIAKLPGNTAPAWVYHISPSDPSGREASFQATMITSTDATLGGAFPDAEYTTGFIGEAVVTGPNKAAFTIPQYGMKKVGGVPQLVHITVDSGTIKRIAPNKLEVTHNLAVYLPIQDSDGDGLPDQGQTPVVCVPNIVSLDTRLPILPPCRP
jgi:hypothetical protein